VRIEAAIACGLTSVMSVEEGEHVVGAVEDQVHVPTHCIPSRFN
jgi:hypothetical protein